MSSAPSPQEAAFLAALNQKLPPGVDWKQGALDYIALRSQEAEGELTRRFHLTKPFTQVGGDQPINQQLQEFNREISHFLNVIALLRLSPQTRFLDVACGSGWMSHFLAKLNLAVVGIDISPDMIELTQHRLALDALPDIHTNEFTKVNFFVHDIEQAPIPAEHRCDVAILESALHHFVNPIQSLRHIADSLSDRGIVIILEAATNSAIDDYCLEIMHRFNTLERPYTRAQLQQILQFAGFAEFQFLHPINGFFAQTEAIGHCIQQQIVHSQDWNTVIATKQPGVLSQLGIHPPQNIEIQHNQPTTATAPSDLLPQPAIEAVEDAKIPGDRPTTATNQSNLLPQFPIYSVGEVGIKGDLQTIAQLSQRVIRKTIVKLSGRKGR
jgi:SAM-dependent methyltransferase